MDISEVNHLGVSAALSLEEAILDMKRAGRSVYVVYKSKQPLERLKNLGIVSLLSEERIVTDRELAIEKAIA